jgi:PAS domain S-box-containing protein
LIKSMKGEKNIRNNQDYQPTIVFWMKISAFIFGALVALLGVLVLVSWEYNIIELQTFVPGFVPMNPLAAIEFVLCGLAICASYFGYLAVFRKLSYLLASLVIILAVLKLLNILGINIPIDQLFFANKLGNFTPPSRMPPIASINFVVLGLAVILLDFKYRRQSFAEGLALISGSFALFMLLSYLFGSTFQSPHIFFSPLALHGSIAFVFLSIAILFLRPRAGLTAILISNTGGGLVARRLMMITLVLPIILAFLSNGLAYAGHIDFEMSFAIVSVLNIIIFEFLISHYSLTVDRMEKEQEKNQQVISKAKSLDDALLSSIGDGVVATDQKGIVILFNGEAERMFGIKAKEAIGKSVFSLWQIYNKDGNILSKKERPLQISLSKGKTITSSVVNPFYYSSGEKKIPVAITVTPVIYNNTISGTIDIFRDISKDVEIDQAKSEFISFASHQLRTPSTAISWLIEMFLEKYQDKLDPQQAADINTIYRENQQMSDLITDFLNISKIEYGISAVQSTPVSAISIIEGVLNEKFKTQMEEKKILSEKKLKSGVCAINADPNLFQMIVDNLISNAIKYTPENGKITVELDRFKAGTTVGNKKLSEDACIIMIADNGYGIPRDEQDKIFTRFYRAANAKDKKIPGTGLGLYMVKMFIEKMGGEIWFESEEGKGTKFFVKF